MSHKEKTVNIMNEKVMKIYIKSLKKMRKEIKKEAKKGNFTCVLEGLENTKVKNLIVKELKENGYNSYHMNDNVFCSW